MKSNNNHYLSELEIIIDFSYPVKITGFSDSIEISKLEYAFLTEKASKIDNIFILNSLDIKLNNTLKETTAEYIQSKTNNDLFSYFLISNKSPPLKISKHTTSKIKKHIYDSDWPLFRLMNPPDEEDLIIRGF